MLVLAILQWLWVSKHQPHQSSVQTGRRARTKPVGQPRSLIPGGGLALWAGADRRHKHTVALDVEMHQACQMFRL